jgi:CubicO group peptidase (beta-lactamase class C family)
MKNRISKSKLLKFIPVIALLIFSLNVNAQVLTKEIFSSPVVDAKKLAQIDMIVNDYVAKHWENGVTVLVAHQGKLVYHKGLGYANRAAGKLMPDNAIYRIMSQTKAITSLAILQLFERGKLDLDQKVSSIIPTYANPKVIKDFNLTDTSYTTIDAKREITIRDLLTHSSGIDYSDIGSEKMGAIYKKAGIPSGLGNFNDNLKDKMTRLGTLPLAHQPGEKFTYGLNSDLLGAIVEIISGKSLEAYFQENIFDPMGMKDTYFTLPASKANRLTTVYTENDQHEIIEWGPTFRNLNPNYPLTPKTYFSGGAGLTSTAYDYAIFLQMILNKGKYNGKQIISPRTAELMISPQLNFKYDGKDDFGLGFALTSEKSANLNARNKGSFSWGGYYGTNYFGDPKENLIVLIMTQHSPNNHWELKNSIENIIYGSLKH